MSIIERFHGAIHAEYRASGIMPAVAILGRDDYETLRWWAESQATVRDTKLQPNTFQVLGVNVFKSCATETGIVMGVIDKTY